jgi:hypothetical protein
VKLDGAFNESPLAPPSVKYVTRFRSSGWIRRNFSYIFKPLSRQMAQLVSKFSRSGIHLNIGAPVPTAKGRAHSLREKMVHGFMDSCRVIPFEHYKPIVCGNEGIDRAQIFQRIAASGKVSIITLLQLDILESHGAPLP